MRKNILHVVEHPGQEKTELDIIKVTVLFSNTKTPDLIATRAEVQLDDSMFQRSITKNIRQGNSTMKDFVTN